MSGKTELRRQMKAVRAGVSDWETKSRCICENVLALPEFRAAKCVMGYMAIGSEAELTEVLDAALRLGKRVCLPVCREGGAMDAVAYTGAECLRKGAYSILEPVGEAVPPEEIDLMLCPGLAFDENGGRLGYGAGYYDRYSQNVHAFLAGICYTECIVESVPMDAHDRRMDALVTQRGAIRIGEVKRTT